ncbi:hypothetical protein MXB_5006 [Myxobolus squamalis]|nr:hypothetical protein MXB_5006 [Myxobolus squamalis]
MNFPTKQDALNPKNRLALRDHLIPTPISYLNHHNAQDHDYGLPKALKSEEKSVRKQFDLLGSPLREFIDPISSSSSESDWVMRCVW